ncbi:pentapeptide repeat-containing protein [Dactylosporangium sp. CA-092794]|uniref:pentapeptide repeat-containing protein n=1 Tax=Dactylosporangium sp. CA-092794 TaxID=3239929 RepID=UPI003D8B6B4C
MRGSRRWWAERRVGRPVAATDAPLQVMQWWWPIVVVVSVVAGGLLAMWLLGVWSPTAKVSDADRLRLDRIKTGLTVVAGLAAGVTLLVTLRRQMVSERAQRFAEQEALEQRTTALYVAAAEQLGSDKPAVRLAGLYALERLGQDNRKLRQTVVDVWCAYLRMPYTPPAELLLTGSSPGAAGEEPHEAVDAERRQELQVRRTAQRLLAAHVSRALAEAGEATYWVDAKGDRLTIDLASAVLVDFGLAACDAGRCDFSRARFHGHTDLGAAHFHGNVRLSGAHFHGSADLRETRFHDGADLTEAEFHGRAELRGAEFHGRASLAQAHFHAVAELRGAEFYDGVALREAQFDAFANLHGARAGGVADLGRARFRGNADLSEMQFDGDAYLERAEFHGNAYLSGTRFHRRALLGQAQFHGRTTLREARFDDEVDLVGALATATTSLPEGWVLSDDSGMVTLREILTGEPDRG